MPIGLQSYYCQHLHYLKSFNTWYTHSYMDREKVPGRQFSNLSLGPRVRFQIHDSFCDICVAFQEATRPLTKGTLLWKNINTVGKVLTEHTSTIATTKTIYKKKPKHEQFRKASHLEDQKTNDSPNSMTVLSMSSMAEIESLFIPKALKCS